MRRPVAGTIARLSLITLSLLLPAVPGGAAELSPYFPTLLVTLDGDRAALAWGSVRDMTSYRVLYDPTPPSEAFDGHFDHALEMDWHGSLETTLPAGGSYHVAVEGYNVHTGDYTVHSNVEHLYVGDIHQLEEVGLAAPANLRAELVGNDVTLSWEPVEDALGYRLYVGDASGDYRYEEPHDVGNVTSLWAPGLPDGATYYVAVSAYGVRDNPTGGPYPYARCEGRLSNEVVVVTPNGDGRWSRESLADGATLATDFSASAIQNGESDSRLVIDGSVPPELFPVGAKLNVELKVKTPDHPEGSPRLALADTFRVIVDEQGAARAEVEHNVPYAPLTYQLAITFRRASNYSSMAEGVAARMATHLGATLDAIMLVAHKDITVGTREEHLAYRLGQLEEMGQLFAELGPLYADLTGQLTLPAADNPDAASVLEGLETRIIAWSAAQRGLAGRHVAPQERGLTAGLGSFRTRVFTILGAYEDGNDVLVERDLGRMGDAMERFRLELARKRYLVDRMIKLRVAVGE